MHGIQLKPTKNYLFKEIGTVEGFILDEDDHSRSAASGIHDILQGDPADGDQIVVPLFRNPRTAELITYEESRRHLQKVLRIAGFLELASGCHSLRIGGATNI